jgi:hypothetical protein
VQQPSEPVGPLDPSQDGEPLQSRIGDRGAEIDTSMWTLVVEMLDELPQYPFQACGTRPRCVGSPSAGSPGLGARRGRRRPRRERWGRGGCDAGMSRTERRGLVLAQQRGRCDEEDGPAIRTKQSGESGQDGTIGRGVPRPSHVAAKHG